ncbi:hypothetical protein [Moorena sp. SIO4G3]|uniref:hypothetical protein n=1 Tax=Moorena sp. SIO4G3 TaxID=2607821 RepID=UPI001429E72C|nr:hypothetical protein [Moorena sp. SIO4G3]NEO77143.1 hypothetical protein [Moorena sp. SIO4G3]
MIRYSFTVSRQPSAVSRQLLAQAVLMQSASGGNHGSRSWGKPPLAALPPQDRAASLLEVPSAYFIQKLFGVAWAMGINCSV